MQRFEGASDEAVLAAFVAAEGGRDQRDAAFTELVDRYERRVYSICYRYFGDHADAQDATQDTFLALVRKADTFRGASKLSTWIYRVAVNACNDIARRRDRRPQTPVDDVAVAAAAAGADTGDADPTGGLELAMELEHVLGTLDDVSRTLVILVGIEGLPYQQAAEVVGLPVGTVKSRVHRARARMADLLAQRAAAGEPDDRGRPHTS